MWDLGRTLTVGDWYLPIPIHRPAPNAQEEDHDDNVPGRGICCDVFDRTVVSR